LILACFCPKRVKYAVCDVYLSEDYFAVLRNREFELTIRPFRMAGPELNPRTEPHIEH